MVLEWYRGTVLEEANFLSRLSSLVLGQNSFIQFVERRELFLIN